jgi:transcriptional regulator with XRE-family HTH domain
VNDLRSRWASNLVAARKAAGLTQGEVAAEVGVTQQAISAWEHGPQVPTTPEHQAALCRVLKSHRDELFPFEAAS